ncbi:MAG: methyltransferase domain-containing protein [Planctomycetes bacterium]|nr:methyltransferase domain-containing protein [Planctomycetota bacterium]
MDDGRATVLDIGCGDRKAAGALGLDRVPLEGVDVVHDLEVFPYPFGGDRFELVRARHVLEHVRDLVALMNELHRVTRPGGRLDLIVPYFTYLGAYRDPTHCRFFTWGSLDYFVRGRQPCVYTDRVFEYVERRLRFGRNWRGRLGEFIFRRDPSRYERHWARALPARELWCSLRVVK